MDILKAIDEKKKQMIELGMKMGLNHKETIQCSQALDDLLNIYEKAKKYSSCIEQDKKHSPNIVEEALFIL